MHDFAERLAQGEAAEEYLDLVFATLFGYRIEKADRAWQRQGVDRFFVPRAPSREARFGVEYKSDWAASRTGNAFIETTSVDRTGRQGWAYTSRARFLAYFVVPDDLIYVLPLTVVRRLLPRWLAAYPTRPARNRDYNTLGVCVPLEELERIRSPINLFDYPDLPSYGH
jgi:hypothetical protein